MRALLICLFLPSIAFGAEFKDLSEARKFLDDVMTNVVKDDIRGAFAKLKPYWAAMPEAEVEVLTAKIIDQRPLAASRFGKVLEARFVSQKTGADSVAYFVYIEKYEKHLLRWHFILYKPRDSWQINAVSFDDRIQGLVE
ncbi:hypothetical protein [Usitatibacter palustris]|uniref:Uncharacterized protein n=1 Tax=Usitatibacter palustris TaxID=2732487 RepID=A0A6M4H1Z7_9PROT|nr:hypothetical protein [Usitatibacter palustris]QJR13551.1 hypothetical protein DSM104440_00335 [Usitatibacter palustris]